MSHDIGRIISTHKSAANRIRIGHDRSILCIRGMPSAGNAMVMIQAPPSMHSPQAERGASRGSATMHDNRSCARRWFEHLNALHPKDLRVARLDFLACALDAGGIVL